MDKFKRLQKEKEQIGKQMEKIKALQEQLKTEITQKEQAQRNCYWEFFANKRNREFVLYDRYQSRTELEYYCELNKQFPLYDWGEFNVKELAEVIKQLYSFERQKEYDILTIGFVEDKTDTGRGWETRYLIPHLYFLVGANHFLKPFQEYNQKFMNEDCKEIKYALKDLNEKEAVSIPLKRVWYKDKVLPLECLTNHFYDQKGVINYVDYVKQYRILRNREYELLESTTCSFSKNKQIFRENLRQINFTPKYYDSYQGIKDVLSFNLDLFDSFIAKVLVSICIYKRNNGITELTSDDYNHIFENLYGEKVDIIGLAEKDITRSLTYVPNSKYGI